MIPAYGFCHACGKIIIENEAFWSINVHNESYEMGVITVLDAETAMIFCAECAEKCDYKNIAVPLKTNNQDNI